VPHTHLRAVAGCVLRPVWSYDGAAWTKSSGSTFPPRTGFALTTLPDRLLLTGGAAGTTLLNDVWSYDGSRWFQLTSAAPFPPRQMHCAVTLGNSLFVFAGYDSALGVEHRDVWRWDSNGGSASSPGTWQAVLPDPEWMPRFGASAAVFNGSIFMLGGADTNDRAFNDGQRRREPPAAWIFRRIQLASANLSRRLCAFF